MSFRSFKKRLLLRMSDSKNKSNVNGVPRAGKESPLSQLLRLAKTISTDSGEFKNYDELMKDKVRLQKELDEKTKENSQLQEKHGQLSQEFRDYETKSKSDKEVIIREFEARVQQHLQNTDQLKENKKTTTELKERVKQAEELSQSRQAEVDRLHQALKSTNSAKAVLDKELLNFKKRVSDLEFQLTSWQHERDKIDRRLQQARETLGEVNLRDLDQVEFSDLGKEFSALSERFHRLAVEFFPEKDVPTLTSVTIASVKTPTPTPLQSFPLPMEATPEAALMRRAAAEILIAQSLVKHVFRPFYVAEASEPEASEDDESGEDLKDAADLMLDFFTDEQSQAIYRFHMLRHLQGSADAAAWDVRLAAHRDLQALDRLIRPADRERFDRELDALLRDATELWHGRVQWSRALVVAELPAHDDDGLLGRDEYGVRPDRQGSNPNPAGAKRHVERALFPRILTRGPTSDRVIYRGVVLWGDQPLLIAARDQEKRELAAAAAGTGAPSGRRNSLRRTSVAGPRSSTLTKNRST